jgi:hypothetical protein
MLLIIELFLVWKARRNGWGPKAFLPIGISFGTGFLIGLIGGGDLLVFALPLDVICVIWTGYMAFRAPGKVAADTEEVAQRILPCSRCGYTNSAVARFCNDCGERLSAAN